LNRHPSVVEVANAIAANDLYSFIQTLFPVLSGGAPLLTTWHLDAMTHALERVLRGEVRRLIITVPPRSLKSICASVALPAFALGKDPTRRIITVSYSDQLAKKHANDFRAIMRSAPYKKIFPRTRISPYKDTEAEIVTTATGHRLATSVGGTLTGRGGNLIIIDDPTKPQDAHSEAARNSLLQWYTNTLLSRLDDKSTGAIIVVMQRLHPEDLVGYLLEREGWEHLCLPAIAEEDAVVPLGFGRFHRRQAGDVLDPRREPLEELERLRSDMGSMDFSAQYQQAPVPHGGNMIKWAWFKFYDKPPIFRTYDRIVVCWDTAQSSAELADYSVGIVMLVRGETVFILDVIRERLEYPELKRKVVKTYHQYRGRHGSCELLVEKAGAGMSLIQDLKAANIHPIAVKPEGDKQMRMATRLAKIEAGAVHLPARAPWLGEFRKEISAFPAGRHDDQVDALSQALARLSRPTYSGPLSMPYGNIA
jgi:predicted phage terminase large subunit-like protein